MKKRTIVILAVIAVVAVALLALLAPYAYRTFRDESQKRSYEQKLQEQAIQYLEQTVDGFDRSQWKFAGLTASERDDDIAKRNRSGEDFVYPYFRVEISFQARQDAALDERITVYLERSESGAYEIIEFKRTDK